MTQPLNDPSRHYSTCVVGVSRKHLEAIRDHLAIEGYYVVFGDALHVRCFERALVFGFAGMAYGRQVSGTNDRIRTQMSTWIEVDLRNRVVGRCEVIFL